MTKKLFIKLSMLLFVLAMSTNVAWADEEEDTKYYVASLKAQKSDASTGDGDVKLTLLTITGVPMSGYPITGEGGLNPTNPTADGATAQLIGGTIFAMDGVEMPFAYKGVYMTSFVYFQAEGIPANGSYLDSWKFTDPAITALDTLGELRGGYYFKVLPDTINNFMYPSGTNMETAVGNVMTNPKNIYAVFKKYLLSNPVVTNNGTVTTTEGDYTTINVSVDVEGDITQFKDYYADFVFPSIPGTIFAQDDYGMWSWDLARAPYNLSATKARAEVIITYTAKAAITAGTHKTTITVKMAGGEGASTLNIPLSVEARPVSAKEASVKIGNAEPVEYETLADAVIAANGASGDVVLTLLKNIEVSSTVTLSNTMTLDLNSYTLSAAGNTFGMIGHPVLKVDGSGKMVILAYNKQGGKIHAAPSLGGNVMGGLAVEVANGTLVLNGGTIASENALTTYGDAAQTAAIKVDAGATLIQNGATITATSAGPKAIGIYNDGTVEINDGSITAEAGFNTAIDVLANANSTTTINGGSLYALAHEEDGTEDFNPVMPAGVSTWSNSYAVQVLPNSTVTVNGGDLYAEATNASRAYGVGGLAGFGGTIEVNRKAVVRAKSPNTMYSFPVAVMAGQVTINGGKFDGHYTSQHTGDTINPAVFGVDYSNFTFKSGMCATDVFFIENPDEGFAGSLLHPTCKMYNVVKGGKDYSDGYRYIAVAETINGNPATQSDLITAGVPAARIGTTGYTKLEDAIAYANNNPNEELVIFMQNDYTLPAGYYTLPAKASLVVPMSDTQSKETNKFTQRVSYHDMDVSHPYITPSEFRRLTFANGVNMDVFGDIEMTCIQFSSNEAYTSQPYGPYGHLVMEEGSHMTLQSGSELRAWGFMTGKGETDARRGSTVREMFQMGDWKGARTSVKITGMAPDILADDSRYKIFPVTQYFIQNIESPVKYHPGAALSTSATVAEGLAGELAVTMTAADIKIVGVDGEDAAIFLMERGADADNTWVRKWYDAENDIQVYDINSAAYIGSMVLDMGELALLSYKLPVRLNSAKFDLPLTNNMKIHLLSGTMQFQQNTSLLPGAEVEVDKESIVSVAITEEDSLKLDKWIEAIAAGTESELEKEDTVLYTGAVYVYDAEQWDKYAYCNEVVWGKENGEEWEEEKWYMRSGKAYTKVVRYTPSWDVNLVPGKSVDGRPTVRNEQTCPEDAKINVHGTFSTSKGFVYTSESGANIFSSNEDAGTFIFNNAASRARTRTVYQVEGVSTYRNSTFAAAQLKNKDNTYIQTNTADAGDAYCYQNDEWSTMTVDADNNCFMVKHNVNGDIYYAKPQEYVAVAATKVTHNEGKEDEYKAIEGNSDHTYSDAAGAGRLFILMDNDCQWWEVEKKDNYYHCIHPNNDTYYYWDDEWKEVTFTISWLNWNGDTLKTIGPDEVPVKSYVVTYGTQAEFLGTNPKREANIDYTYDFTGWSPTPGKVTSDVTYTATFEQKDRMYTIIFNNEGGTEIERQFLKHNDVPVCENTPTKVGHILQWSPAISPVIGDQTYTATWLEEPPTEWDVTFVNNANGVLQATSPVGVNEHPTYNGDEPVKENADHSAYSSNEYTYTFWGWSAVIDGEAQQFADGTELPCPTAPTTYTAVYTEAPKLYAVTFRKEDSENPGNYITIQTSQYQYGEMPVCATPLTKDNDAEYTYKLVWTPQIQTVMDDAVYTATFPGTKNRYSVTLKSNPSEACTFTGAGMYEYNTSASAVTVTVTPKSSSYEFKGWTNIAGDTVSKATSYSMAITGDINLVANLYCDECENATITWRNEDGSSLQEVKQAIGTATTYTGATPTKPATAGYTYAFDGWTTAANGAGTYYRNGMTPKATVNATYFAHFAATAIPNLEMTSKDVQVLTEPVTYQDLVLTSNGTESAQLLGQNYLTLTGNAYFDLAINAENHKWYAVAVPWQVDVKTGISVNGHTLQFGRNFDILYYDGAQRADQGTGNGTNWKYMETEMAEANWTLEPGKLYMIGLTLDAPVIRFAKKEGAPLLTITTSVSAYGSANDLDAGWNGIANPAIFYAYVNAGVTTAQVYDAATGGYNTIDLSTNKLVLGQPVFVQVSTAKDITVTYGGAYAAAPRRAKAENTEANYEIRIAPMGAQYTDRLFIAADEEKTADKYVIGKDLAKMGTSSKVAQMWVNNYNTKLCMSTAAPIYGITEYPLGIYAPKAGEYIISSQQTVEDYDLYLTMNGEAIWNLNKGAYTLTLNKGTEANYGLRISSRKAPEIVTGLDEAVVDSKDAIATKVLIGNQVFIIRGDKVYSIDGQLVK